MLNVKNIVGFESSEDTLTFNTRDMLLYAIGIGFSNSSSEIRFIYENDEFFQIFPLYLVVLPFKGSNVDVVPFPSPGIVPMPEGLPISNPALVLKNFLG